MRYRPELVNIVKHTPILPRDDESEEAYTRLKRADPDLAVRGAKVETTEQHFLNARIIIHPMRELLACSRPCLAPGAGRSPCSSHPHPHSMSSNTPCLLALSLCLKRAFPRGNTHVSATITIRIAHKLISLHPLSSLRTMRYDLLDPRVRFAYTCVRCKCCCRGAASVLGWRCFRGCCGLSWGREGRGSCNDTCRRS